ncbi:hypothetical protein GbCGDNIH2_5023 [Granulibacter bethesdensis]|nr:hypothetical protein GbCGDNIH2_5023 [Granulibacter bethesdensis]
MIPVESAACQTPVFTSQKETPALFKANVPIPQQKQPYSAAS